MEKPVDPGDLRSLFIHFLDLPASDRDQFLANLPSPLREELQALIDSDLGAETMIRGIVDRGKIPVGGVGERFGFFKTTELLGRGGMGAVYKAERTDGEISQTVAIKVIE